MIKKIVIFLTLIFFTASCGFTPIYSNKKNADFIIKKIVFNGDKTFNNFLRINLKKYNNPKHSKKFYINSKNDYKKNILSKDSTGKVTNYELIVKVTFSISLNDKKVKEVTFEEKKIMESMDDKFEESRYEITVKQNFASSISNKLILELISI